MQFNGQAEQDAFVAYVTNFKKIIRYTDNVL